MLKVEKLVKRNTEQQSELLRSVGAKTREVLNVVVTFNGLKRTVPLEISADCPIRWRLIESCCGKIGYVISKAEENRIFDAIDRAHAAGVAELGDEKASWSKNKLLSEWLDNSANWARTAQRSRP